MTTPIQILLCDDDSSFASQVAPRLEREVNNHKAISGNANVEITTCTLYGQISEISKASAKAQNYDIILCDLGWGDHNLAGIQILNDFQLSNPEIFAVLYTAQDEDDIIAQTLEWKLNFIDRIIKVDGSEYFFEMLESIVEVVQTRLGKADKQTPIKGKRLISETDLETFENSILPDIKSLHGKLMPLIDSAMSKNVDLQVTFSQNKLGLQFKASRADQQEQRYLKLTETLSKFPRLEAHDLVALSKKMYLEFVKKTYGSFPGLADERGLDLNNIYRVNRRFKNLPIIVFRFDTVQEMIGKKDSSLEDVQNLLASKTLLKCLIEG